MEVFVLSWYHGTPLDHPVLIPWLCQGAGSAICSWRGCRGGWWCSWSWAQKANWTFRTGRVSPEKFNGYSYIFIYYNGSWMTFDDLMCIWYTSAASWGHPLLDDKSKLSSLAKLLWEIKMKKSTVIMVLYGIFIWYYHVLPENYQFEDIYNFRQIPFWSDFSEILTVFFALVTMVGRPKFTPVHSV